MARILVRVSAGWLSTIAAGHLFGTARLTQGIGIVITTLVGSFTALGVAWIGQSTTRRRDRRERLLELENEELRRRLRHDNDEERGEDLT